MSIYILQILFSVCGGELCMLFVLSFSSISTVSYLDEIGHHDEHPRLAVTMENTYQLGEMEQNSIAHINS